MDDRKFKTELNRAFGRPTPAPRHEWSDIVQRLGDAEMQRMGRESAEMRAPRVPAWLLCATGVACALIAVFQPPVSNDGAEGGGAVNAFQMNDELYRDYDSSLSDWVQLASSAATK